MNDSIGIAWRRNLTLASLAGVVLLATMVWLATPRLPPQLLQFVAEHGNIAAALLNGDGFANPFGTPSGPTAWTPPAFPCYLVLVFAVFGTKTVTAAWVMLVLDAVFAAACVFFVLVGLDLVGRPAMKPWFAVTLVALTWLHEAALGPWLSTGWFVAAFAAAFLTAAAGVVANGNLGWWWLLTIAGGVLVLTHAGCGAACIALVFLVWLLLARRTALRPGAWPAALWRTSRRPLIALAVFAAAIGLWTARNWIVFHQLIPLKSTGWFEIYLAESYTTDGVLDDAVMVAHHPFSNPRLLVDYTVQGEAAFLSGYRPKARALLAAAPGQFAQHVLGRALSVFSYCDTAPHIFISRAAIRHDDVVKMIDAGLVARFTNPLPVWWTSLNLSSAEFAGQLDRLQVEKPREIERDWLNAKAAMLDAQTRPSRVLSSFSLAGLPAACLLGALALRRRSADLYLVLTAVFYLVAVLPNVLITHYAAHQLHFLGLHSLFLVSFGAALHGRWLARPGRPSPPA